MDISCAFATSLDTPAHVKAAEELGYRRAWLYDSPALYPDVWAMLALSASVTTRIGLGPGVLIPSLRHPMTNAAAIAMLEAMAPGRVMVGVGSGFTGRVTLGQRALPWSQVETYVRVVQGLVRGEQAEWEGKPIAMLHPAGFGAPRPVNVPWVLGVAGPRSVAVARSLGAGAIFTGRPPADAGQFPHSAVVQNGTVLQDGEDAGSERVMEAAGHVAAVVLHGMYERKESLAGLPGGAEWAAAMDALPAEGRHLRLHEGHLMYVAAHDRPFIGGELIRRVGAARTAAEWRARLGRLAEWGLTEVVYQPAGSDIPGELRRFMEVAARRP